MSSGFFCWKAETIAHSFHETKGSNSDVSNDILASQQYQKSANNFKNQQPTMSKTSHQINGWCCNPFLGPHTKIKK